MLALTRQLAVEYGPDVRVNAVVPGPIRTPVWDRLGEPEIERSARATALLRLGPARGGRCRGQLPGRSRAGVVHHRGVVAGRRRLELHQGLGLTRRRDGARRDRRPAARA
jgi:NAD(P)-dependent dehydrogenase (short-subunit alcohol dehydrogenase family)